MIVDSLLLLSDAGFEIREYQYTGMGSIYFYDFILFHRLLGIHNMLRGCATTSPQYCSRRVDCFSCPSKCLDSALL